MFTVPKNEAQLRVYIRDLQRHWDRLVTGEIEVADQESEELRLMQLQEQAALALRKLLRRRRPRLTIEQIDSQLAAACGR